MFLLHLLAVFTTIFFNFIHPTIQTALQNQSTNVLAAEVTKMPTPIPIPSINSEPTATPITQMYVAVKNLTNEQLIDCIGPDGKHLHVTQKMCDDFNDAWQRTKTIPPLPTSPYGQATKIANHTYELQLPPDDRMATVQELLTALNAFRQKNGVGTVTWNTTIANYAQNRANFYANKNALDEHQGFMDFINNQNGFSKLGFNHLGENASYAGPLNATHLIEWVFAADAEHNGNQLNKDWTNVGIGINGIATDIIFAASQQ